MGESLGFYTEQLFKLFSCSPGHHLLIFEKGKSKWGIMSSQQSHALRADNQINSPYKRAAHRWVGHVHGTGKGARCSSHRDFACFT